MKIKIDESNDKLVTLIDTYCNAHITPWHWFFGWRNYENGVNTYRISKVAWEAIQSAYDNSLDNSVD